MPGRLQNKSALITGAGSGIGLESSLLFAAEGANVLLVDINLEGAQKGANLIKERFPNVKAIAVKADVGKEADVKNAVDTAVKEFGRLDVMVWISQTVNDQGLTDLGQVQQRRNNAPCR